MNESEENFGLEDKRLSLIDVSFDDDFLLYSPSPDFQPPHKPSDILMERKSVQFAGFGEDANTAVRTSIDLFQGGKQEQPPQQPAADSSEPEGARKTGKYNLRKSLAWDSAFFTSAGVLEPEELSSMIGGGEGGSEKREKKLLPGIEEEVHRSTDSISTLASDNLTLETLEADLFGDIRASIQKSNKASSPANSGGEVQSGTAGNKSSAKLPLLSAPEIVDIASGSKLKTKAALKKASVVQQGSGKVMKQVSVPPQIVARTTSSISKPPKVVGRGSQMLPTTTKRASIGTNRAKVENDNAKDPTGRLDNAKQSAGRGVKVPTLVGTRNTPPRPVLPVKSSLGSSLGTKTEITTSSSVDGSGSLSSDNSGKSSLHSVRRKVDSRAGSTLKPTLRTASRKKSQSATSHLSPHLKTVSKLGSSISPASSISEWSSGSLSPTSTLNKKSNSSSPSLDVSSCKDATGNGDAPSQKQAKQKGAVSTGSNVLHRPDSSRPSGLRMPSPKIGFFDGVRSSVHTPNGSSLLRPVVPSSLPRADVVNGSPTGESNKAKVGKLQPHRTVTAVSPKICGQALPSSTKSNSHSPQKGPLSATPKVSCTSKRGKCSPQSVKVHTTMSIEYSGEGRLNGEKASSGKSDMVAMHPNLAVVESNSKDKMTADGKGNDPLNSEITSTDGRTNTARHSSFNSEIETIAVLKEDKDLLCSQKNVNKNLHSLDGSSDKLSCLEEQVGGLIKQNKDQVADSLPPSEEPAVGKVI